MQLSFISLKRFEKITSRLYEKKHGERKVSKQSRRRETFHANSLVSYLVGWLRAIRLWNKVKRREKGALNSFPSDHLSLNSQSLFDWGWLQMNLKAHQQLARLSIEKVSVSSLKLRRERSELKNNNNKKRK